MCKTLFHGAVLTCLLVAGAVADDAEKYTLRYKFQPGETLRWEVEHRSKVRTTVSGTTQTAETLSTSVKAWRVTEVRPDGTATFEHSVERVDMRQQLTGRDEVRYNSQTDAKPPAGFEDVAKSVGVPLSTVTMDAAGQGAAPRRGTQADKPPNRPPDPAEPNDGWMTIPLPDEARAGRPHLVAARRTSTCRCQTGGVKKVKAVQQFTLEDVKTGVATIRVWPPKSSRRSPIRRSNRNWYSARAAGRVRFDIDAGRIIGQQMDIDKHVVGFRGDASSIHYVNRFSEQLLPPEAKTAERAGGATK